ncbi:hypothetical protein CEUSTIGMA_g10310.t1 [Chlamydomonas eustigma]|uniref:Uncharacterized protein n=1 Tax=Chlamydomonas eustigma TaxID=1157962 RepID=A0A250XII4_9CHLO|nr:hypothetical protein CEUSTIGMA_g10310.t1 [Chlamydomonas eustigma]|eukprot:GAX82884.1 hypothetical protein CEUSTIGMA_g10310.t1 [Chlamydomonas eustigma]
MSVSHIDRSNLRSSTMDYRRGPKKSQASACSWMVWVVIAGLLGAAWFLYTNGRSPFQDVTQMFESKKASGAGKFDIRNTFHLHAVLEDDGADLTTGCPAYRYTKKNPIQSILGEKYAYPHMHCMSVLAGVLFQAETHKAEHANMLHATKEQIGAWAKSEKYCGSVKLMVTPYGKPLDDESGKQVTYTCTGEEGSIVVPELCCRTSA